MKERLYYYIEDNDKLSYYSDDNNYECRLSYKALDLQTYIGTLNEYMKHKIASKEYMSRGRRIILDQSKNTDLKNLINRHFKIKTNFDNSWSFDRKIKSYRNTINNKRKIGDWSRNNFF